jgi:hypothetical protein
MQISQIIKLTQIKTKITLMFEKNDLNFIGVFNFSWLQTMSLFSHDVKQSQGWKNSSKQNVF